MPTPAAGSKINSNVSEEGLLSQFAIIREFFQTDSASEMINSLNVLTESYLFTESLNVTTEIRVHIANQLRVVTLIARLEKSYASIKGI